MHAVEHNAATVSGELVSKRHYFLLDQQQQPSEGTNADGAADLGEGDDAGWNYDPRFLIFEFIKGLMLRKRQVQLIDDFLSAAALGDSSVHQMIMGGGKTAVITPLLALMLANGRALVTVVMPRALLDMSRGVLRTAFANVLDKKVYTLNFDRSSDLAANPAALQALYEKLDTARTGRGVVVTTPETCKSLMLKYLDLLQSVEAAPTLTRVPVARLGDRASSVSTTRDQLKAQAVAADKIAAILKLWRPCEEGSPDGGGIALIDEVDLVLHPLKSELNFPIGDKHPLDGSPGRWDLPTHLLEAFFFATTGRGGAASGSSYSTDATALAILHRLRAAVESGTEQAALMSTPHLVLLKDSWYKESLMPVCAEW